MAFDIANEVFVTACLVVVAGSQIQGKLLFSLASTPLLAAWIFSCFLAIIGVLQWTFGGGSQERKMRSTLTRPTLDTIILHMADITIFFISMNYAPLWSIAISQLLVLNFWQLFTSTDTIFPYLRASVLCSVGLMLFIVEVLLQTAQPQWALIEIGTAMVHAYANYYLHHHAQRHIESAQYLNGELFASGTLVALLAPFAWLEFNTIYLPDVNISFAAVALVLTCTLCYCYRRCGIFFNSLTQHNRVKCLILVALTIILLSKYTSLTPLMMISFAMVSASAYLSTSVSESKHEFNTNFSVLVTLCTIVLLAQGVVVVQNANFGAVELTPLPVLKNMRTLQPIPLTPEYEFNRLVCLRKVRERVIREVSSHIKAGEPIAYLDMPLHWNLGDTLIWQGTQHLLEVYGQFPISTDRFLERNISVAKTLIKDGVFLLHGGGNFGDLWRDNANFRIKVAVEVKNNDVIFLPQSTHYNRTELIKKDNTTFKANDRLTFMFRDHVSVEFSRKNFPSVPAKYVPDMAFAIMPQTSNVNPVVDIVFLLRYDSETVMLPRDKQESQTWLDNHTNITYEVWDFPILGFPIKLKPDNVTVVYNYTQIYPKQWSTLGPNNRHAFLGLRNQMANNLLSRGRLIITDRLHASVMATLMGKPMIYLDNNYKKITNVRGDIAKEFKECSDTNLHARHTKTLVDAVKLASKILNGDEKI